MSIFFKKNCKNLLFCLITFSLSVCSLKSECFAAGRQRLLRRPAQQAATVTDTNLPIVARNEEQQQIHFVDERNELEGIIQAVIQRNNQNTQQLIQQINIPQIPEGILRREQFLEEMGRRETAMLRLGNDLQTIAADLNDIRTRLAVLENANNRVIAQLNMKSNKKIIIIVL